nr:TetR/AcrR family transcriptional regulator [Leifsonia soli]
MLRQYLPDRVDVAATLERYQELIAHPRGWAPPGTPPAPEPSPPAPKLPPIAEEPSGPEAGYRTGRERRAKIVDGATALFAREGYGDTSLLDIATRVGVSKSALYHHFPSKDALLHEVMRERDRRIDDRGTTDPGASAADVLRSFADGAAANEAEQPGLIELYAVISSEATPRSHDAHAYFEHRFTVALDGFATLLRAAAKDGALPPHRDPEHEALWLLALWDGLQYQWLYDHASVDVAAQLRAHLADILPGGRA